jgi:hypothetical protein
MEKKKLKKLQKEAGVIYGILGDYLGLKKNEPHEISLTCHCHFHFNVYTFLAPSDYIIRINLKR